MQIKLSQTRRPRRPSITRTLLLQSNKPRLLRIIRHSLSETRRHRQLIDQIEQGTPTTRTPPPGQIHTINLHQVGADLGPVACDQLAEAPPSPGSPNTPW